MNLRQRLTLWYSLVLAMVLLLFGTAVYSILSFSLLRQVDLLLLDTLEGILLVGRPEVGGFEIAAAIPPLGPDVYVQLWNTEGQQVQSSANLRNFSRPLDPENLAAGRSTMPHDVTIQNSHLRVITRVVAVGGQPVGNLQVAASLDFLDRATSQLLVLLIGGSLMAVAASALIGAVSARRALKPIETITEAAVHITRADDLSRRIPLHGSPTDEVGQLVTAFNATLERLETLFDTQRRFLADISHELRTPLTAIRGNVDLLRRMGGADPTSLDAIQSEAERMTRLVTDLLLLAQAETGHLPIAKQPVALDGLLLEVYQQAVILASGKVEVTIGEVDQVTVSGDRDRLKQLILNLVANALQYTPENGRVTLGLSTKEGWSRLTVTDTGPGIPREELPYIFERFYRVDKARKRSSSGGAGLGLSIAHTIAKAHGGRVEVASEIGKGSTFSVWLPLAGPDPEATRPLPQDVVTPKQGRLSKKRASENTLS